MYKAKLIALLEGLECQNIDRLIETSSEHLRTVGIMIAKYAKIGAESDIAAPISTMHLDGGRRCDAQHCKAVVGGKVCDDCKIL